MGFCNRFGLFGAVRNVPYPKGQTCKTLDVFIGMYITLNVSIGIYHIEVFIGIYHIESIKTILKEEQNSILPR